mmetsp:Transcript_47045/g.47496  ORF Transcript_47045/g.47496 Transcript_47045/m.47496 type:complete len:324 (-) Transcript_47045:359-1330(-)
MKWFSTIILMASTGCSSFTYDFAKQNSMVKGIKGLVMNSHKKEANSIDIQLEHETSKGIHHPTRVQFLDSLKLTGSVAAMTAVFGAAPNASFAAGGSPKTGANDGNLPDLPPPAVKAYLQYRVALQISADYYMYELQGMVGKVDDWGDVNQLFAVNQGRSGGQPSRVERDYINPMRILALSMPPDIADELRDAQFKFERAAQALSKATAGVRRDLPVELSPKDILKAKKGWDDGRLALNEFFTVLNKSTGLNDLKPIPPGPLGDGQIVAYGRSQKRYFNLMKKTKLCQNRGGPILSQAWGGLMITGYIQDSCGIPDLEEYFFQ